jgi:hypothetical protein
MVTNTVSPGATVQVPSAVNAAAVTHDGVTTGVAEAAPMMAKLAPASATADAPAIIERNFIFLSIVFSD